MSRFTGKVVLKHFGSAKTKDMKSYFILTVKQELDDIILHTGSKDLKTLDKGKITMGICNLTMTCRKHTNSVLISGIVPRSYMLNEKASKVIRVFRHECNMRNICFIDDKHISPDSIVKKLAYL